MDDLAYLKLALEEARKSPPKPTNFRVGALLVSPSSPNPDHILVSGYTLECPGNTHAEQSCFVKLAALRTTPVAGSVAGPGAIEAGLGPELPEDTVLYTTMEPCNKRSVGNLTCVERILRLKDREGGQAVRRVVFGVGEPETFVGENEGKKRLEESGIEVVHVTGLEEEILKVATAGHETQEGQEGSG